MFGKKENFDGMLTMVSVYDEVADKFGVPVTIDNDSSAVRAFCDMVANKSTTIGQHPGDFTLYKIGYFNSSTGQIFAKFDKENDVLIRGLEAQYSNEQNKG